MHHLSQSLSFIFPVGAAINRVIYPGAMLDPDHASNDLLWTAAGTINSVSVQSPVGLASDVSLSILDIQDADGQEVHAGGDGPLYALEDSGAVALSASLGDPGLGIPKGTLIYNVVGSDPGFPTEMNVAQSRKVRYVARHRDGTNAVSEPYQFIHHPIPCHYGMGIFVTGPDALVQTDQLSIMVEFTPRILGGTRYSRARLAQGSQYIV